MPIFFVPFIILAGFLANTATLPYLFKWMGYISPFKYCIEVMLRAEFKDVFWFDSVLETFDYNLGSTVCLTVIICIVVGFRVAAYWLMTRKVAKFN